MKHKPNKQLNIGLSFLSITLGIAILLVANFLTHEKNLIVDDAYGAFFLTIGFIALIISSVRGSGLIHPHTHGRQRRG